jgi:hypothetical protein
MLSPGRPASPTPALGSADSARTALPLTFITGFLRDELRVDVGAIDTQLAFWLLGVGSLVVGMLLILRVVARGSPSGLQQL